MAEGYDVQEHMNTFSRIINELLRLDSKFDDEDKAMILVTSLSDLYDHFVTTLLYGKRRQLSLMRLLRQSSPKQERGLPETTHMQRGF